MPSAGNEGGFWRGRGRAWETCASRIMSEFVYIRSQKSHRVASTVRARFQRHPCWDGCHTHNTKGRSRNHSQSYLHLVLHRSQVRKDG